MRFERREGVEEAAGEAETGEWGAVIEQCEGEKEGRREGAGEERIGVICAGEEGIGVIRGGEEKI